MKTTRAGVKANSRAARAFPQTYRRGTEDGDIGPRRGFLKRTRRPTLQHAAAERLAATGRTCSLTRVHETKRSVIELFASGCHRKSYTLKERRMFFTSRQWTAQLGQMQSTKTAHHRKRGALFLEGDVRVLPFGMKHKRDSCLRHCETSQLESDIQYMDLNCPLASPSGEPSGC